MSVQYPYRAVICGEEHNVKGWRGRKLVTDKGSFYVRHIYGDWQIQAHRLFEIATIQSDGKNGWLLNGKVLPLLRSLPMGIRLADIPNDEVLRVHRDTICAVVWMQTNCSANVTGLLDLVLEFWKAAASPDEQSAQKPSLADLFANLSESLHHAFTYKEVFAPAWSKPIWLTEFRPAAPKIQTSPQQKELAKVATELHETRAKLARTQAAANDTLKEALSKWMRFDPPRMSANTQARIEKAVKLYVTDPEKRSLKKIADEFGVSRKTVSVWFARFTAETGYTVVVHRRHLKVSEQFKADSGQNHEEEAGRIHDKGCYRNRG